jgi:hypothetical protein
MSQPAILSEEEKTTPPLQDDTLTKDNNDTATDQDAVPAEHISTSKEGRWTRLLAVLRKAAAFGRVEIRGITPIPVKERTVTRTVNVFTLWWSMNTNILP